MVAGQAFGEAAQQRPRVRHAARRVRFEVGEGVDGGEAGRAPLGRGQQAAARHGNRRDAGARGRTQDADGGLAVQGLRVQGALAGDDEAGVADRDGEAQEVEQQGNTRPQASAQRRQRREAHPARRAGARGRGGRRTQHRSPVAQPGFQHGNILRARTLLRPIHRRRTRRTQQRVVHVASQVDVHSRHTGQVHSRHRSQPDTAERHRGAGRIQHPRPQCRQHPGTTIRARTPADAQHDPRRPGRPRRRDQLTCAITRRSQRRRQPTRQPLQTGSLGQLHHGNVTPQREERRDPPTRRPGHAHRHPAEPGGDGGGHRAVTAVRHRELDHRLVAGHRTQAGSDRRSDLRRRERALELVGRDQHCHD